jgi:hypothetical protein
MTEDKQESGHAEAMYPQALSKAIHFGVPIASIIVLLAFAAVLFLPTDKTTLPVETTTIYIPVYILIVVVLVFASMYLFKRLMDAEGETGMAH